MKVEILEIYISRKKSNSGNKINILMNKTFIFTHLFIHIYLYKDVLFFVLIFIFQFCLLNKQFLVKIIIILILLFCSYFYKLNYFVV